MSKYGLRPLNLGCLPPKMASFPVPSECPESETMNFLAARFFFDTQSFSSIVLTWSLWRPPAHPPPPSLPPPTHTLNHYALRFDPNSWKVFGTTIRHVFDCISKQNACTHTYIDDLLQTREVDDEDPSRPLHL